MRLLESAYDRDCQVPGQSIKDTALRLSLGQ